MSRPVQRLKFYDRVSSRRHFSRQPRASPWEQNTSQATILAVLSANRKLSRSGVRGNDRRDVRTGSRASRSNDRKASHQKLSQNRGSLQHENAKVWVSERREVF